MEPETVKRYRLRPTALASEQERGTRLILPLMLTCVAAIVIVAFGSGWHKLSVGSIVFVSGLITVYAVYAFIVVPKKIRARLARCWPTYELEIGPAYLLRRQIDLADLKLEFTEIKKAVHTPGRYLRVFGSSSGRRIAIPESLEGFDDVVKVVAARVPIRTGGADLGKGYVLGTIAGVLSFSAVAWVKSPVIVVPSGLVLAVLIVWNMLFLWRNPSVTRKAKLTSLIYLPAFLFCVFKVVTALRAPTH